MIVAHKLSKSFRERGTVERFVLQDLDLEIRAKMFALIQGVSGAGKSTLLAILGARDFATSGRVQILGKSSSDCSDADLAVLRRKVGFVLQQPHYLPTLSVRRNVEMPLIPLGMTCLEQQAAVQAALELVGMAELGEMPSRQLSGGERQRMAIARALVARPDILIADEPTSHLDECGAEKIARLFQDLQQSGLTVVVASHDPRFVRYATIIRRLHGGRFVHFDG